jgi:hypothetical protein
MKIDCPKKEETSPARIAEAFVQSEYAVIRKLVDLREISSLYEYTLKNMTAGNLKDDQAVGSPSFYQDTEMIRLHKKLLPKIESLVQLKLYPTFCYYRTYRTGAILKAHKDRKTCQISVSLNLGQQGDVWDFWLIDRDENARIITLNPGDALLYRGCNLTHGRGKLVHADYVSQVFFFFISPNGLGKLFIASELIKKYMNL